MRKVRISCERRTARPLACDTSVVRALRILSAAASVLALLAACGDGNSRTEGAYCGEVGRKLAELNSPIIALPADAARVLDAWSAVSDSAPLAIELEWNTMIEVIELAITVDPDDPASLQTVADTARESERAANRVISYTQERCGLTIGGVLPTAPTP